VVEDRLEEKNRKGISTFIATLLLMVLAVAAGVVIYAYTMGYLGGFGSPTQMGAISIDSGSFSASTRILTVYIRNIGKTSVLPQDAYILSETSSEKNTSLAPPLTDVMAEGAPPKSFAFTFAGTYLAGQTYNFKIVCKDNTQISFLLKAIT
jgi:hypothetical protein